ncbi:ATP-binding protein [Tolumonas lignilytica]|uniref:ATP-binding protein n=1 Tax=Tolumonas lignilytica TaxID=1283284 RepID=UPI000465B07A|nr:ATP-binding protein [Tolumonas lignilytica]
MALVWNDEYLTGIPEIDEQHKGIFREMGSLAMSLLQGKPNEEVLEELKHLAAILREHINYEELMMFQEGCLPEVIWGHSEDHQLFLQHLHTASTELITRDEIRAFLRYAIFWMRYHILTIDKPVCSQFLAMRQGMSAEEAHERSAAIVIEAVPLILGGLHQTYSELYDSQLHVVHQNSHLLDVQRKLKQTNQELEDRVILRTNELTEANKKLQDEYEKLRLLNQKLESAQGQLLQSEKMAAIGQLAAGVAHEINNPVGFVNANLGTLKSYVESLLSLIGTFEQVSNELPAGVQNRLDDIKKNIELDYVRQDIIDLLAESADGLDRVKQIVQDLKDFARAGESVWQNSDLHRGLDSTLNVVWNELKYKAKVHKEYGDLPLVRCVPAQINQVFMNILVNAAHAIDNMGDITLKTGVEGDYAWISITDTGRGMSDTVRKRIFEPFFTTKPVGQGTGLGLSLTYSIIQKHKGRIEVESTEGVGTTFKIYLPIAGLGEQSREESSVM